MAVSLNLDSTVRYLNTTGVGDLDALYQTTLKKAEELGVASDRRPAPAIEAGQLQTGNTRGILRFVESLDDTADRKQKRKLGVILGTMESRMDQAGYKPATTPAVRRIQRRRARRELKQPAEPTTK